MKVDRDMDNRNHGFPSTFKRLVALTVALSMVLSQVSPTLAYAELASGHEEGSVYSADEATDTTGAVDESQPEGQSAPEVTEVTEAAPTAETPQGGGVSRKLL